MAKYTEYRGVTGLVYAKVTKDTEEAYETGEVKSLAGVAEITKTTEVSNETHYYDNIPAINVSSTGADEITLTVSAIPLDVLADITGQIYDETTGALIEGERSNDYFAIGYVTENTDNESMYVWRLKGSFAIPDSTHVTKDDGTDANGQELVFTGIQTTHKFTKTGKGATGVVVNASLGLADVSTFFDTVTTPDTLKSKA